MKNFSSPILIIGALIIGIVGVYALAMSQRPKISTNQNSSAMKEKGEDRSMSPVMTSAPETNQDNAAYIQHSPEALEQASNSKRVLFFYANWCPTCLPADRDFSNNVSQIPADVTVIRVNYNDNQTDESEKQLARQYGVTYQHTFVQLDSSGNEITKWNGGQLAELQANLK